MVHYRLISLLCFIAQCGNIACQSQSIQISVSPERPGGVYSAGTRVSISCTINNFNPAYYAMKVRFYCPLLTDVPCFTDCIHPCDKEVCASTMNAIQCMYKMYEPTMTRSFEYTITLTNQTYQGDYQCMFQAKSSETLSIKVEKRSTVPTSKPTIVPPQVTTIAKKDPTLIEPVVIPGVNPPISTIWTFIPDHATSLPPRTKYPPSSPNIHNEYNDIEEPGLKEKALCVLAMVFILFFSFVVNMFCCIRCVLIKHYAKYPRLKIRMGDCMCMADEIDTRRAKLRANFHSALALQGYLQNPPSIPDSMDRDIIYAQLNKPFVDTHGPYHITQTFPAHIQQQQLQQQQLQQQQLQQQLQYQTVAHSRNSLGQFSGFNTPVGYNRAASLTRGTPPPRGQNWPEHGNENQTGQTQFRSQQSNSVHSSSPTSDRSSARGYNSVLGVPRSADNSAFRPPVSGSGHNMEAYNYVPAAFKNDGNSHLTQNA